MSKKKTSTQDFLNLLEDETPTESQMAFAPAKKKATAAGSRSSTGSPRASGFAAAAGTKASSAKSSSPKSVRARVLGELIDLAQKNSPKFVVRLMETRQAKRWLKRLRE